VYHCFAFKKHLMADYLSGYVYEMNDTYTSDVNGDVMRRVRRAPALGSQNRLISYGKFELYLMPGNGDGDPTSQGYDPQVMLQISNNGGRTFCAARRCGSGQLGDYHKRVFWLMNGQSRNRVFQIVVTDPVLWFFVDAFLEWQLGDYEEGAA